MIPIMLIHINWSSKAMLWSCFMVVLPALLLQYSKDKESHTKKKKKALYSRTTTKLEWEFAAMLDFTW